MKQAFIFILKLYYYWWQNGYKLCWHTSAESRAYS